MKTSRRPQIAIAAMVSTLLAASLIFASVSYFPTNGQTVKTTYSTLTTYSIITQEYLSNGNFSILAPAVTSTPCTASVKSEPLGFVLAAKSGSPALLCVSYYYYGLSPMNLNTTAQLKVFGWPLHPTGTFTTFDASSNFTITSSVPSLELGGPSNLNEGTEVTYTIQAKPGVNGTFEVNLANLLPGGIGCDGDFLLSVGSGSPSYARPGLCSLVPYVPSASTPLTPGFLFSAIIGATNSTG
jgi:hypothetical protein